MNFSTGNQSVIPIAYLSSSHFIYARAHTTSKSKMLELSSVLLSDAFLAMVNVLDATELEYVLFDCAGKSETESTTSQGKKVIPLPSPSILTLHETGSCTHLIFLDSSPLAKAFSPPASPRPRPFVEEPRGLSLYDVIRAHADSFIERFEFDPSKRSAYGQTLNGGVGVANKNFMLTGQTGSRRKKGKKEKDVLMPSEKQRKAALDLK
ncbi:hypothetical protein BDR07DRAFT_1449861 [Suillus spraguei]|nr:hypothetical protein BDR07DRAFT_1449861 [Suillus spraguei]